MENRVSLTAIEVGEKYNVWIYFYLVHPKIRYPKNVLSELGNLSRIIKFVLKKQMLLVLLVVGLRVRLSISKRVYISLVMQLVKIL